MQTTANTKPNAQTLSEIGTSARLKARVSRMPASLGGHHYYLYPGQLVYITGHAGGIPRCSVIKDASQRSSEDFFSVSYDMLEIIETETDEETAIRHLNDAFDRVAAVRDAETED